METIEFEVWERTSEDPRKVRYVGQRIAQEVFEELKHRLESLGYLPDEYFSMGTEWENGREIPKGADLFCTTDYGGSEGVYLDVYLKWHGDDGKPITKSFITGKTLGENGADLDRMFLTASAITKAVHGDHATHSRYMMVGPAPDTGGSVVHLSQAEQRILIDALVNQRNQLMEQTLGVEQLLRRVTGSITEYVNEMGRLPLQISDYDMAVLAVQDGNLEAFNTACLMATDRAGDLLAEAAGRPGTVGRKMTLQLLCNFDAFSSEAYLAACKKAVETGDPERVLFLTEQAQSHVKELDPEFYGEVISHAFPEHGHIARQLVKQCTPEQIAAASPYLLYRAVVYGDERMALELVDKGADANQYGAEIIQNLYAKHSSWLTERLLEKGMNIDNLNYSALHTCIKTDQLGAAKMLLDRGMDFDQYQAWAAKYQGSCGPAEAVASLAEHWESLKRAQEQSGDQQMGGMALG